MEDYLDKLTDMIWYLTLNFGRNHPESYVPEESMIEDNIIWNCSFGVFVCDLGRVIYGVGDIRLLTYIDDETLDIKVYKGRSWGFPKELVFHYRDRDMMPPEIEYNKGDWEQLILREYKEKQGENYS